jgi:glycosyltransferase involved in cell wall biosynthesis
MTKGPNVLGIVAFKVFPAQMGGQQYVVNYYNELSLHCKLVLVVSKDNKQPIQTTYPVHPFMFNHWYAIFNLIYLFRFVSIIKKEQIDTIMIDHSYVGWLGILLRFITKKKLVIKSANIEALRFKDMQRIGWRIYDRYEGWVHRNANFNFFITETEKHIAINRWKLDPSKCKTITYGSTTIKQPSSTERNQHRNELLLEHQLEAKTKLFFFNGTLDYLPNTDALYIIVQELLFRLDQFNEPYKIIICGNRITADWEKLLNAKSPIIFKGYVDDINKYYKGTDCFICPITLGTGIKTKLVEALANGQQVICCKKSGAGFNQKLLGNQLVLIENYNWGAFAEAMMSVDPSIQMETPPLFYDYFNWRNIVEESILSLQR